MFLSCIDYILQLPNGWLAIEKTEYSWSCKDDRQWSQVLANCLDIRKETLYSKAGSVLEQVPRAAEESPSLEVCETPLYTAIFLSECLHLTLSLALC